MATHHVRLRIGDDRSGVLAVADDAWRCQISDRSACTACNGAPVSTEQKDSLEAEAVQKGIHVGIVPHLLEPVGGRVTSDSVKHGWIGGHA